MSSHVSSHLYFNPEDAYSFFPFLEYTTHSSQMFGKRFVNKISRGERVESKFHEISESE